MTTLYKLTEGYEEAVATLADLAEIGEIDQETLNDTLEGIEGELQDKALNVAMHIKNLRSDVEQYEKAAKEFQEKAKSAKRSVEFYENYLDNNMQKAGLDNLKNDYAEIKYRKMPDIVDVIGVPTPDFERVVPEKREPDKVKIKEALKSGESLPFATLITGRMGLQVK